MGGCGPGCLNEWPDGCLEGHLGRWLTTTFFKALGSLRVSVLPELIRESEYQIT